MPKVYYKKQRILYGFSWMLIFAAASYFVDRFFEIRWLATTLMIFSGLSFLTGLFGQNEDSDNPIGLACPKCKILHSVVDVNIDPQSSIFNYGEDCYRIREKDGLHIYPLLCLNCNTVTEFASDHQNVSGHAVCGQEYFDSRKITKTDLNNAFACARKYKLNHFLSKLNKIKI